MARGYELGLGRIPTDARARKSTKRAEQSVPFAARLSDFALWAFA